MSPPLDPIGTGVRIFVGQNSYDPMIDQTRTTIVYDATIPAGAYDRLTKTGWKVNGAGTAWKYKNSMGVSGITAVALKLGKKPVGSVKVVVKGKNVTLPANYPEGISAGVVADIQLRSTPSAQCGRWESMNCPPMVGTVKCTRP
jgi:hypothetical protein